MKKQLLVLVLAMVMLLGAGCSQTIDSGKARFESKPLDIWHYLGNKGQQEALNAVVEKYNQSQSANHANLIYIPFDDMLKKISAAIVENSLPDIVIIAVSDHAYYASTGILADLTDKFDTSGYYADSIASCTYHGRLYGVPFGANCLALFYNTQMFEEAGLQPPDTWDELRETARTLKTDGVYGFGFSNIQSEEGTFNDLVMIYSAGTDETHLDNEAGISAYSFIHDLVTDGSMSVNVINATQAEIMEQFGRGELAMMINGSWQVPVLQHNFPETAYNIALLPKGKQRTSVLGGENYAVIAGKNEDGALDFIRYMTGKQTLHSLMSSFGYISANRSVASTQFLQDLKMQVFVRQMESARVRGPNAEWLAISRVISGSFTDVITGKDSPEQAARKAQRIINALPSGN